MSLAAQLPAQAPIDDIGQAELTDIFQRALIEDYGVFRDARKEVANDAQANVRAAQNWLAGVNVPELLRALKLAAHSPQWRKQLLWLIGETGDELHSDLALARALVARMERDPQMPTQVSFDFGAARSEIQDRGAR